MSRKIIIDTYQGNTHYSIHVIDSFGQEHHIGYFHKNENPFNKLLSLNLK